MVIKRGATGGIVSSIQQMLVDLGFKVKIKEKKGGQIFLVFSAIKVDGVFGPNTEAAVIAFQSSEGFIRDGIVGPDTLRALEEAYSQRLLEINSPGPDAVDGMPNRLVFERVKADKYQEGYDRLSLRTDAATAYRNIYEEVKSKGGVLTSSGGIRSLSARVGRSRSAVSFHYLGLALDLFIYSGMVNLEKDPYVISHEGERLFRVWARCDKNHAETDKVENVFQYNHREDGVSQSGSFFDLTALFEKNGFKPIKSRPSFEDGGSLMGAEWWHFQYETGLIPMISTFGSQLLKVYSEQTLEGTPPWQQRDRIFKVNWF